MYTDLLRCYNSTLAQYYNFLDVYKTLAWYLVDKYISAHSYLGHLPQRHNLPPFQELLQNYNTKRNLMDKPSINLQRRMFHSRKSYRTSHPS